MIFHGSIFEGHHMMDWELGHLIPMIFGWGIFVLAAVVILYVIIQNTRTKQRNQTIFQEPINKRVESGIYKKVEEPSSKTIFCYNCGEKLDGSQSFYCPICGTKI